MKGYLYLVILWNFLMRPIIVITSGIFIGIRLVFFMDVAIAVNVSVV
jgi:hypothetical protein